MQQTQVRLNVNSQCAMFAGLNIIVLDKRYFMNEWKRLLNKSPLFWFALYYFIYKINKLLQFSPNDISFKYIRSLNFLFMNKIVKELIHNFTFNKIITIKISLHACPMLTTMILNRMCIMKVTNFTLCCDTLRLCPHPCSLSPLGSLASPLHTPALSLWYGVHGDMPCTGSVPIGLLRP